MKVWHRVFLIGLVLFLSIAVGLLIGGCGGGGGDGTGSSDNGTPEADATATYGAEQFHIQLTAIAEPEE